MLNQGTSLRLYPRGFLGSGVKPQLARTPNPMGDGMVKRFQYHMDSMKGVNSPAIEANPHVASLYADYIKHVGNTSSFEFHNEVLRTAVVAFGTLDFALWFQSQYRSPACGDLHRRFLDDTLKFLSTGRREMSLETWGALLVITDEGDNIGKLSTVAKEYFGAGQSIGNTIQSGQNYLLTDVLQQWCSKPNGFEDLVGTLHILFGNV